MNAMPTPGLHSTHWRTNVNDHRRTAWPAVFAASALAIAAQGCIATPTPSPSIDFRGAIDDGAEKAFPLTEPGEYALEMTARNDRVAVAWPDDICPGTDAADRYTYTCSLPAGGDVVLSNPKDIQFWLPADVTLKITRLGRPKAAP